MEHSAGRIDRRRFGVLLVTTVLAQGAGYPARAEEHISIYFDWGKTELGPNAKKLVGLVKQMIETTSRVSVVGHCDTSEEAPDRLSLARATVVQKALLAAGVPPTVPIAVSGKGARELSVPTGPGVHEAHNRYAAITIA